MSVYLHFGNRIGTFGILSLAGRPRRIDLVTSLSSDNTPPPVRCGPMHAMPRSKRPPAQQEQQRMQPMSSWSYGNVAFPPLLAHIES